MCTYHHRQIPEYATISVQQYQCNSKATTMCKYNRNAIATIGYNHICIVERTQADAMPLRSKSLNGLLETDIQTAHTYADEGRLKLPKQNPSYIHRVLALPG